MMVNRQGWILDIQCNFSLLHFFKDFRTRCHIASKQHVSVTLDASAILGGAKNFPLDSSGFLLCESNWKKQYVLMLQLCFDVNIH